MTHLILWKDSDAERLKRGFPDRYPETACDDSMNEDAVNNEQRMDPIEVARMIDAHIAELLAERNKLRDTLKEIAVMTNPGSRLNYPLDTLDGKLAEIHHKAKTL